MLSYIVVIHCCYITASVMENLKENIENYESDEFESDDDWDYRFRSSSGDSYENLINSTSLVDLSMDNLDEESVGEKLKQIDVRIINLNLSENKICGLPKEVLKFRELRILDLSGNNLSTFPDEICQLTKLRKLIATKNFLTENSFPKNFAKVFSSNLTYLSLGANQVCK